MFGFDWQNIVVLAIVISAVAYLSYSAFATMRSRKRGCAAGCSNCGVEKQPEIDSSPIVSIEQLTASARQLPARTTR